MKGHIQLTSLSNLRNIDLSLYDKRLFIVRSLGKVDGKSLNKYTLIHVPQLSPSMELFDDYVNRWSKDNFTSKEKLIIENGITKSWWDIYIKRFLYEMTHRKDMIACLHRINDLLDQGKNILLICFCPNPFRCHRGLIGYYFMKKGYTVYYR